MDKVDHKEAAAAREISQLKNKPNLLALRESFLEEVQEAEDMMFDVRDCRWLDDAEGAQLDELGDIVGLPRVEDWDDELYRAMLKVILRAYRCAGECDELLWVLENFTDASYVTSFEFSPATIQLSFVGTPRNDAALYSLLHSIKAGGVKLWLDQQDETEPFGFAGPEGRNAGFGTGKWVRPIRG